MEAGALDVAIGRRSLTRVRKARLGGQPGAAQLRSFGNAGIDHIMFNRLLTVGLTDQPHTTELDHAIAEFERAGMNNWIVQVPPQAVGWADACARRGLQPHPRPWVKFHRPAGPLEAETLLSVREADPSEAHAFATTAVTAFGLPAIVADWFGALVGRRRWHCFLARENSTPVGAGAVYVNGAYAWLGIAGTLTARRRLGAQWALLAAPRFWRPARRASNAICGGSERIATEPASREVSEILGVAEGAIVVVLDRVILALDGRPVEWRMGWCDLAGKHYHAQIAR